MSTIEPPGYLRIEINVKDAAGGVKKVIRRRSKVNAQD